jgi:hypothetical protein
LVRFAGHDASGVGSDVHATKRIRTKVPRTNAITIEAAARFRIDELCDQSASPASEASVTVASVASLLASVTPPSQGVVEIQIVAPESSGQHWHFMPHDVLQTSGA